MNPENLDDIIKKYSEALTQMGQLYGGEAEQTPVTPPKKENEQTSPEERNNSDEAKKPLNEAENGESGQNNEPAEAENEAVDTEPAVSPPATDFPESELTSSADFSAVVFSGEGTYPVVDAKVVVYRGDDIYTFLTTDENGRTKSVKLPAFEKENSLESDNPDRSIDYFADVFATGFISQKGLLVSAVGGSEILLNVLMIPESERIS